MAIIKDGKLMNTPEDNEYVEQWLSRQPKIKVKNKDTGEIFEMPYVEMQSDYKWQLNCLNDRLEHPERYEKTENVPETIARLRQWLADYERNNGIMPKPEPATDNTTEELTEYYQANGREYAVISMQG